MKSFRLLLAAFVAACFITVTAVAADVATPTGTWKYTQAGRGGNAGVERTLTLDLKDGKLTGTLKGASMGQFEIPDTAIADGSFKDGVVKFSVSREFNGNTFVVKYEGKLDGDTITGSTESPGRDGAMAKRDWVAKRSK